MCVAVVLACPQWRIRRNFLFHRGILHSAITGQASGNLRKQMQERPVWHHESDNAHSARVGGGREVWCVAMKAVCFWEYRE
jgi:hypothetical protein